jgi:hypothetical protein
VQRDPPAARGGEHEGQARHHRGADPCGHGGLRFVCSVAAMFAGCGKHSYPLRARAGRDWKVSWGTTLGVMLRARLRLPWPRCRPGRMAATGSGRHRSRRRRPRSPSHSSRHASRPLRQVTVPKSRCASGRGLTMLRP